MKSVTRRSEQQQPSWPLLCPATLSSRRQPLCLFGSLRRQRRRRRSPAASHHRSRPAQRPHLQHLLLRRRPKRQPWQAAPCCMRKPAKSLPQLLVSAAASGPRREQAAPGWRRRLWAAHRRGFHQQEPSPRELQNQSLRQLRWVIAAVAARGTSQKTCWLLSPHVDKSLAAADFHLPWLLSAQGLAAAPAAGASPAGPDAWSWDASAASSPAAPAAAEAAAAAARPQMAEAEPAADLDAAAADDGWGWAASKSPAGEKPANEPPAPRPEPVTSAQPPTPPFRRKVCCNSMHQIAQSDLTTFRAANSVLLVRHGVGCIRSAAGCIVFFWPCVVGLAYSAVFLTAAGQQQKPLALAPPSLNM